MVTERLLIVGPAWLGDTIMSDVLVQRLKQQRPAAELTMLVPPATATIAQRLPGVDQVQVLDVGHGQLGWRVRRAMGQRLRGASFQRAYVLPNSFKSALVPFWARIAQRTGWLGEQRYGLLTDHRRLVRARYPLMIERFLALAEPPDATLPTPYPIPQLRADPINAERVLLAQQLVTERRVLALAPGAEFGPAKRWPTAHFATVAQAAMAAGLDVWLVGGPNDAAAGAAILQQVAASQPQSIRMPSSTSTSTSTGTATASRAGRLRCGPPAAPQQLVNLCGQTTLADAIDLVAVCDALVSNDSGLMHVAAALNVPVIALYGSSSPDFTPPLADHAQALRHPLPCSPCFARTCRFGHTRCLTDLAPARVIHALGIG